MKKSETWAQWKYRTDPKYKVRRLKANKRYQNKLKKNGKKKKQRKSPKARVQYQDKKGHALVLVNTRETSQSGPLRIPYLYCNLCDKFFKLRLDLNPVAVIQVSG